MHVLCTAVGLFALLLISAALSDAAAACTPISTIQQLSDIRKKLDGNYCLTKDLNGSNFTGFQPIGDPLHPFTNPFRGTLDGRGHAIRNLKISTKYNEAGLIMRIGSAAGRNGWVKNLDIVDIGVNSTQVSSLVGTLAGVVSGKGKVTSVSVTGRVQGKASASIGGFVGRMEFGSCSISRSHTTATVVGASYNIIGGFVGEQLAGLIELSSATGPVTSGASNNMGGFAGNLENDAIIRQSYTKSPVKSGDSGYVGGFVGHHDGQLIQVFERGSVTVGAYTTVGGLVGIATSDAKVKEAYAVGKITFGASPYNLGGLIGFGTGTVTAGFWDTQTTGQGTSPGGGVGRTTAQLKAGLPLGFAGAVWAAPPNAYPVLKANPL